MSAKLSWLDLTAADRDKVRRVLSLFNEQGTVDELGLGGLRDAFSDALFPGTSVLHTRLRYMLFIPWIYREIESWGGGWSTTATCAGSSPIASAGPAVGGAGAFRTRRGGLAQGPA